MPAVEVCTQTSRPVSDTSHTSKPDTSISKEVSRSASQLDSRRRKRGSSGSLASLRIKPFGFQSRTSFDATGQLLKSRSDSFVKPEPKRDLDIWKRLPPDFRPQVYAPRPPKRNSRDAIKPWSYVAQYESEDIDDETVEDTRTARFEDHLPKLLQPKPEGEPVFNTLFRKKDVYSSKLSFAKKGMYKPEPYQMPKLHDFRGYPPLKTLGLPEFEVNYEKDPYNIYFLSKRLQTIHGHNYVAELPGKWKGIQMAPPKPPQPSWESRLILQHETWPHLCAAYTRHKRIGRTAHSALMERVEDALTRQWAHEKHFKEHEKDSTENVQTDS